MGNTIPVSTNTNLGRMLLSLTKDKHLDKTEAQSLVEQSTPEDRYALELLSSSAGKVFLAFDATYSRQVSVTEAAQSIFREAIEGAGKAPGFTPPTITDAAQMVGEPRRDVQNSSFQIGESIPVVRNDSFLGLGMAEITARLKKHFAEKGVKAIINTSEASPRNGERNYTVSATVVFPGETAFDSRTELKAASFFEEMKREMPQTVSHVEFHFTNEATVQAAKEKCNDSKVFALYYPDF